jgi:hypothetical protein
MIVPDQPNLRALVGPAGVYYRTLEDVKAHILSTQAWDDKEWQRREALSMQQAEASLTDQAYADLVPTWQTLIGQQH